MSCNFQEIISEENSWNQLQNWRKVSLNIDLLFKVQYHAKSESSFLMTAIVTINAINEINKELTLAVCLFLLIFCNVTFLD
jgi:hypothetical protein